MRYIVKPFAGMFVVYDTLNRVSSVLYMEWEAKQLKSWLDSREAGYVAA